MRTVDLLLLIAAAVCFGLATFGTITKRVNLVALGLLLCLDKSAAVFALHLRMSALAATEH